MDRATLEPTDLRPRFWPLVVGSWLPLLAIPLASLLRERPATARLLTAMLLLGIYIVLYLLLVLRWPPTVRPLSASATRRRLCALGALTIVGLALYPVFGTGIPPWYLVFATIAAGIALPPSTAGYTIAVMTAIVSAIATVTAGWGDSIAATIGIAVIGGSAIAVRRLIVVLSELGAAREELARLAVAEERLRFARDLHDLLGHSLSLIALKSELARELVPSAPQRGVEEIRDVEEAARVALREVRAAVTGYRQPSLVEELAGARELLSAAGIVVRIEREVGTLSAAHEANLAWAVREGATNVIRHSGARVCTIRIARCSGVLTVEIADDGRGYTGALRGGNGLTGLAERVAAHDGELVAEQREGGGFRLRISLPLNERLAG